MRKSALILLVMLNVAAAPEVASIEAIDFALDWKQYIGKVVRVTGAKVGFADVQHTMLLLPGSMATVDLAGVPRDTVKHLIQDCQAFGDDPSCTVTITGTVGREPYGDNAHLTHAKIDLPPS